MEPAGRIDPQIANAGFVSAAVVLYAAAILLFLLALWYMSRNWHKVYETRTSERLREHQHQHQH